MTFNFVYFNNDRLICYFDGSIDSFSIFQSRGGMINHLSSSVRQVSSRKHFNLLKADDLNCPDLVNEDDPDCIIEGILYEIVNTQNLQVRFRARAIAEVLGYLGRFFVPRVVCGYFSSLNSFRTFADSSHVRLFGRQTLRGSG